MEKRFYVYVLISSLDSNVFYVGKGTGRRMYQHDTDSNLMEDRRVHRKISKIQRLGGDITPSKVFETNDEQEALDYEIGLIKDIGRDSLTNLTDGGDGSSGYRHTDEAKEKMRQSQLGIKPSKEAIAKRTETWKANGNTAWNKGKKMSPEFCKKVAKGGLGREPWNKGKSIPLETRLKISATLKKNGRKMSDDNKRKLIEKNRLPKSKEHKQKLSDTKSQAVICVETKEVFKNSIVAGKAHYVCGEAIRQSIKTGGKSCGFHWEKINKKEN